MTAIPTRCLLRHDNKGSHRFYDNASHILGNFVCIKDMHVGVSENNSIIFLCSFQRIPFILSFLSSWLFHYLVLYRCNYIFYELLLTTLCLFAIQCMLIFPL